MLIMNIFRWLNAPIWRSVPLTKKRLHWVRCYTQIVVTHFGCFLLTFSFWQSNDRVNVFPSELVVFDCWRLKASTIRFLKSTFLIHLEQLGSIKVTDEPWTLMDNRWLGSEGWKSTISHVTSCTNRSFFYISSSVSSFLLFQVVAGKWQVGSMTSMTSHLLIQY